MISFFFFFFFLLQVSQKILPNKTGYVGTGVTSYVLRHFTLGDERLEELCRRTTDVTPVPTYPVLFGRIFWLTCLPPFLEEVVKGRQYDPWPQASTSFGFGMTRRTKRYQTWGISNKLCSTCCINHNLTFDPKRACRLGSDRLYKQNGTKNFSFVRSFFLTRYIDHKLTFDPERGCYLRAQSVDEENDTKNDANMSNSFRNT